MKKLLIAFAAFAALVVLTTPPANAITNLTHGWAGFEAYPPSGTNVGWEGVSEWLTIPAVTNQCGTSNQLAVWVGLGGSGYPEFPFTQNGLSITQNGIGAWYETFDANGNTDGGHGVTVDGGFSPGDQVLIREIWGVSHQSLWLIWTNETTGLGSWIRLDNPGLWAPYRRAIFINEDLNFGNTDYGAPIPWTDRINFTNAKMERNEGSSNTYGADGTPIASSLSGIVNADEKDQMSRTKPYSGQVRMDAIRPAGTSREWYSQQYYCS